MKFREWMNFERSSYLFDRVLHQFFPDGDMDDDGEGLVFTVYRNKRLIVFKLEDAPEPYVEVIFQWNQYELKGAFNPDASLHHGSKLQNGTLDFSHLLKDVVTALGKAGLGVKYTPVKEGKDPRQQQSRERMYQRSMKHRGFMPVPSNDPTIFLHKPTHV
jgi:hypothetical protein